MCRVSAQYVAEHVAARGPGTRVRRVSCAIEPRRDGSNRRPRVCVHHWLLEARCAARLSVSGMSARPLLPRPRRARAVCFQHLLCGRGCDVLHRVCAIEQRDSQRVVDRTRAMPVHSRHVGGVSRFVHAMRRRPLPGRRPRIRRRRLLASRAPDAGGERGHSRRAGSAADSVRRVRQTHIPERLGLQCMPCVPSAQQHEKQRKHAGN